MILHTDGHERVTVIEPRGICPRQTGKVGALPESAKVRLARAQTSDINVICGGA
jgi:hypothetical protein